MTTIPPELNCATFETNGLTLHLYRVRVEVFEEQLLELE